MRLASMLFARVPEKGVMRLAFILMPGKAGAASLRRKGPTSRSSRLRRSCSSNSSASRLMSACQQTEGEMRLAHNCNRMSRTQAGRAARSLGLAGWGAPASAELKATSARRFCKSASRSSSSLASSALLRRPSASCSTNSSTWRQRGQQRQGQQAWAGRQGSYAGMAATDTSPHTTQKRTTANASMKCAMHGEDRGFALVGIEGSHSGHRCTSLTRFFPISNSSCFTKDSCNPLSPCGPSRSSGWPPLLLRGTNRRGRRCCCCRPACCGNLRLALKLTGPWELQLAELNAARRSIKTAARSLPRVKGNAAEKVEAWLQTLVRHDGLKPVTEIMHTRASLLTPHSSAGHSSATQQVHIMGTPGRTLRCCIRSV
jgi:hypothetical protein